MIAQPARSKTREPASPLSKLVVGFGLCLVAVLLVHLVDRWGARGVSYYLRDIHALLQQSGGKWICAGLIALLGLAFCWTAVKQMLIVPPKQRFAEGAIVLKSIQWAQRAQETPSPPSSSE